MASEFYVFWLMGWGDVMYDMFDCWSIFRVG